jgi:uncharacterized protein (DUF433 family)
MATGSIRFAHFPRVYYPGRTWRTLKEGAQIMATATLDWSDCPLVEIIPGKVSGVPLLKNTRLPVDAITGNYDAFRDEGLSPDEAIAETLDCYPEAGLDTIKAILSYRAVHIPGAA